MTPPLSRPAVLAVTSLVMVAFAANSVLARLALQATRVDAVTFTAVRLAAGAVVLALVLLARGGDRQSGSWASAAALFAYAAAFSLAYRSLAAGTGALLLFGAVQLTMIGWGRVQGDRLRPVQSLGVLAALGGLLILVAPGVTAPSWGAALTMAASGVAWGVYSLRGRGQADPVAATAGNFARSVPLAAVLVAVVLARGEVVLDPAGVGWAVLSGAVTSGLGYVAWYAVLPSLRAAPAATVQLSVPILAALGGVLALGEPVTARLAVASAVTLGGIALVVNRPSPPAPERTVPPSPDRRGSTATARSAPAR